MAFLLWRLCGLGTAQCSSAPHSTPAASHSAEATVPLSTGTSVRLQQHPDTQQVPHHITERSINSADLPTCHSGDTTATFAVQKHIKVQGFFVSFLSELEQSHTRKTGKNSFWQQGFSHFKPSRTIRSQMSNDVDALGIGKLRFDKMWFPIQPLKIPAVKFCRLQRKNIEAC